MVPERSKNDVQCCDCVLLIEGLFIKLEKPQVIADSGTDGFSLCRREQALCKCA